MTGQYPDIRRPSRHESCLKLLVKDGKDDDGGIFETMRDALVFAASVGFSRGRREEFTPERNSIAWSTMAANQLFEQVLLMITASSSGDTPEQLGESAVRDRVTAFEEYACGGLSIIEEEMSRGLRPETAVLNIIGKQITDLNSGEFNPFDGDSSTFDAFA